MAEAIVATSTLPPTVSPKPAAVILPLATLIIRLGRELAALHVVSGRVQEAMELSDRIVPLDARSCAGMQGLDTLTQHLGALATLLADLALILPKDVSADVTAAVARLSLGRLHARLIEGEESEMVDAGVVDLF